MEYKSLAVMVMVKVDMQWTYWWLPWIVLFYSSFQNRRTKQFGKLFKTVTGCCTCQLVFTFLKSEEKKNDILFAKLERKCHERCTGGGW